MAAFYFRLCQSIKLYLSINRSVLPLLYVTILHILVSLLYVYAYNYTYK